MRSLPSTRTALWTLSGTSDITLRIFTSKQNMPGICGIVGSAPNSNLGPSLAAMTASMTHHEWYAVDKYVSPQQDAAFGRVSLGFVNTAPQPAHNASQTALAVMAGEYH